MPINSDDDMLNYEQLLNSLGNSAPLTPARAPSSPDQSLPAISPTAGISGIASGAEAANPTPQVSDDPTPVGSLSQLVSQSIAKKYGFSPQADSQALASAQDNANDQKLISNLGAAFNTISHGISRSNKPVDNSFYTNLNDQADQGVKNVILKRQLEIQNQDLAKKQESEDPNSAVAQKVRSIYAPTLQRFGMDPAVLDTMSAEQIKNFAQQPLEQQAKLASIEATKQISADARNDAAQERATNKRNADQDKSFQTAQQLLESARGNPAAAQAERDIYAAQKANSLADLYGDPNKLSLGQVKLLASEIGKIASGGVPTMEELKGITPNTLMGQFSTQVSNLLNRPTPANAAAFVKQYKDYANALSRDAQRVIQDKYGRVIESRRNQLGEDNYQQLKTHYLDRFKDQSDTALDTSDPRVQQAKAHGYSDQEIQEYLNGKH